jgi:pilus assembly protein CpaE
VWDHDPRILLDGRRMADVLGVEAVMGVPTDRVRTANALNAGRPLIYDRESGAYGQAVRRACNIAAPAKSGGSIDRMRRAILRSVERSA